MLKGKDALAEFVDRLAYDTESGRFFVNANDLAVGNSTKTPHSGEHGERAEINSIDRKSQPKRFWS